MKKLIYILDVIIILLIVVVTSQAYDDVKFFVFLYIPIIPVSMIKLIDSLTFIQKYWGKYRLYLNLCLIIQILPLAIVVLWHGIRDLIFAMCELSIFLSLVSICLKLIAENETKAKLTRKQLISFVIVSIILIAYFFYAYGRNFIISLLEK